MVSPLRLLLKDGTKNAFIQDGVIVAPGSKFDGMKASESNLMKAINNSGSKPTNLNNYKQTSGLFTDFALGSLGLRQGTGFSAMERYRSLYDRRNSLNPKEQQEFIKLDNLLKVSNNSQTAPVMQRPEQPMNQNTMMANTNSSPSVVNKGQRQQLMNMAMLGKLGLI